MFRYLRIRENLDKFRFMCEIRVHLYRYNTQSIMHFFKSRYHHEYRRGLNARCLDE